MDSDLLKRLAEAKDPCPELQIYLDDIDAHADEDDVGEIVLATAIQLIREDDDASPET